MKATPTADSTLAQRAARVLYQLLLVIVFPAVLLRLWWRGRREPEYRQRIGERFGKVPATIDPGPIWLHSVSAGETNAMAPLVARLQQAFPQQHFLVTTMTPTGSAQVQRILGDSVDHCYAPYDFAWAVNRFYQRVQPRMLVLMETELWPNLVAGAAHRQIPALLINARLSERSAAGYQRIAALTQPMLRQLNAIACQDPEHAERFVALGAHAGRTFSLGSIKYDKSLPADHGAFVASCRQGWHLQQRWVWIAASTHPGEDEPVLEAHQALLAADPDALLLLVPRHPVRADEVLALAQQKDLNAVRQQTLEQQPLTEASAAELQVIVADTMGQLQNLFGLAKAAFVGGSLVDLGGHDPIEAALCQIPIAMGPYRFNFPAVCEKFAEVQALQPVADAAQLAGLLKRWHSNESMRVQQGQAGAQVVAANTGARQRTLDLISGEIAELG